MVDSPHSWSSVKIGKKKIGKKGKKKVEENLKIKNMSLTRLFSTCENMMKERAEPRAAMFYF
jgi:hypothetical protein